jgi:type VI secretion system protein ImpC
LEGLFDQVLEQAPQQLTETAGVSGLQPRPGRSQWDLLIADLVEPYLLPKADPQQAEYVASVDAAVGELMRQILHHPQFQALEASWRALNLLVSRLETAANLKLFVWDVSKAEIEADVTGSDDPTHSGVYRLLVEQSVHVPEGKPWSLIVGDYGFGPTRADAELLGRLAKIAQAAGAPLLAGAHAALAGCESFFRTPDPSDWQIVPEKQAAQAWAAVRALAEASWVGLAVPRFLLRLPYGRQTNPIEKFEFDELPGEPDHEGYLWGNPAFACACLLGQSFTQRGWSFRPGMVNEIDDLPVHVYKSQWESAMKPCAEALLTDRAAEAIAARGLIPLRSVQNQGAVRVEAFWSIAGPASRLRGRWK